jgi:molecular chaperone HscA
MRLFDSNEPSQSTASKERIAIGIDLGTTNSLVAYSKNSDPKILSWSGKKILPSIVSFLPDQIISVGELSLTENVINIRSIKRLMGKSYNDVRGQFTYCPLISHDNNDIRFIINEKEYSPVQISAEILKKLKNIAEDALQQEVSDAVITVPAYFDDAARNATKDAARLAGLNVLRLLNEPTAAALAYNLDKQKEGVYLIYDLGGGTFDISILKMQKGLFQVLGTSGDTHLGGDDFDLAIFNYFLQSYDFGENLTTQFQQRILDISRKAKEILSTEHLFETHITFHGNLFKITLDFPTFENLIKDFIDRTIFIAKELLVSCDIQDINGIVLVGGSTRIPLIKKALKHHFDAQIFTDLNPDEIVALGASLQADALTYGSENLLLDVTPLSLGLEVMGGIIEKVINRNTPIPISITQEFTTFQDGQDGMQFHILQGERELAKDCKSLAYFELEGIPPLKAGIPKIKVNFAIDANGILTVSAFEEKTGISQKVQINPSYGLKPADVAKLLHEAMLYAKQDRQSRLLLQARSEAKRYIHEIEAALIGEREFLPKDYIEELKKQLQNLKNIIEKEERNIIEEETQKLLKLGQSLAEYTIQRYFGTVFKGKSIENIKKILEN